MRGEERDELAPERVGYLIGGGAGGDKGANAP